MKPVFHCGQVPNPACTPTGQTWQSSGVGSPVVVNDNGTVRRVKVSLPSTANTRYARLRVSWSRPLLGWSFQ